MKILLFLLLPLSVFAQQFTDASFALFWDTAKTDTQAAIFATGTLTSQPFRVKQDMTAQVYVQAGDTTNNSLDSSKVKIYFQYALDDNEALYTYTWDEVDSIGIDSTMFDKSLHATLGVQGVNISVTSPAVWARAVATGLATNCLTAGDSTKFSVRIQRYSAP